MGFGLVALWAWGFAQFSDGLKLLGLMSSLAKISTMGLNLVRPKPFQLLDPIHL